eukprot:280829-Chlamydomonas_euryale.AAC.7
MASYVHRKTGKRPSPKQQWLQRRGYVPQTGLEDTALDLINSALTSLEEDPNALRRAKQKLISSDEHWCVTADEVEWYTDKIRNRIYDN